ncbi:hypothetical protein AVEN_254181-1 [Araneus ventricosus]|uniref:Uncharacterized protein n=1 Tax=Araneus ventricosus TaxID=182803 RepID=A0A4Y2Q1Q8_ARAVE|nr:hypothetical protein AVEN_254181-1 [Araneus ventricosus]
MTAVDAHDLGRPTSPGFVPVSAASTGGSIQQKVCPVLFVEAPDHFQVLRWIQPQYCNYLYEILDVQVHRLERTADPLKEDGVAGAEPSAETFYKEKESFILGAPRRIVNTEAMLSEKVFLYHPGSQCSSAKYR